MDTIKLEKFPGSKPAYQQIMAFFEKQIQSGRMKPGEKLPAERDLAEEIHTARGTVKKAYEELVRRRLIEAESRARQLRRPGALVARREPQGQGPPPHRRAHRRAGPPQVQRPRHPHLLRPPPARTRGRAPEPERGRRRLQSRDPVDHRAPVPDHPPRQHGQVPRRQLARGPRRERAPAELRPRPDDHDALPGGPGAFPRSEAQARPGGRGPDPQLHHRPGPADAFPEDRRRLRVPALPGHHPRPPQGLRGPRLVRLPALLVRARPSGSVHRRPRRRSSSRPGIPCRGTASTSPPSRISPSGAASSSRSTTRSSAARCSTSRSD
ncbi:MAG: GntR family transcriptional regulator [Candidatus Moduliflexus flocculans]|nr:GntR family transcriptional regulator [Candidatus Moduliflexus flocculans]